MMIAPDKSLKVGQYVMAGDLFTKGFPAGGGPCRCSSTCCSGGVYVDRSERDVILAHRDVIAKEMDETQDPNPAKWFEAEEMDDPDFPSGKCVGTEVVNDKCVFLDKAGRCAIQLAAVNKGLHKWALKPLFCVLFPIEITNGVVGFDDMLQEQESCCSVQPEFEIPFFEGCREELEHLVGKEGFAMMQDHYAILRKGMSQP
jgi:hypothetical protein